MTISLIEINYWEDCGLLANRNKKQQFQKHCDATSSLTKPDTHLTSQLISFLQAISFTVSCDLFSLRSSSALIVRQSRTCKITQFIDNGSMRCDIICNCYLLNCARVGHLFSLKLFNHWHCLSLSSFVHVMWNYGSYTNECYRHLL